MSFHSTFDYGPNALVLGLILFVMGLNFDNGPNTLVLGLLVFVIGLTLIMGLILWYWAS